MSRTLLDNFIEKLEAIKAKYSFADQELLVKKDIDDLVEQMRYLQDHVIHSTKQIDKFVHEVQWMDSNKILPSELTLVLVYDPEIDEYNLCYINKERSIWLNEDEFSYRILSEFDIKDTYWQELTKPL